MSRKDRNKNKEMLKALTLLWLQLLEMCLIRYHILELSITQQMCETRIRLALFSSCPCSVKTGKTREKKHRLEVFPSWMKNGIFSHHASKFLGPHPVLTSNSFQWQTPTKPNQRLLLNSRVPNQSVFPSSLIARCFLLILAGVSRTFMEVITLNCVLAPDTATVEWRFLLDNNGLLVIWAQNWFAINQVERQWLEGTKSCLVNSCLLSSCSNLGITVQICQEMWWRTSRFLAEPWDLELKPSQNSHKRLEPAKIFWANPHGFEHANLCANPLVAGVQFGHFQGFIHFLTFASSRPVDWWNWSFPNLISKKHSNHINFLVPWHTCQSKMRWAILLT